MKTITTLPPSKAAEENGAAASSEILLKADDQLWQVARLFRKSEAFDVLVDLISELASIDEKLKQLARVAPSKASAMRAQLLAERGAVEGVMQRHIGRMR